MPPQEQNSLSNSKNVNLAVGDSHKPRYFPSGELSTASSVAQFLNRPLLLAGEPGTGKTCFADHWAAITNSDLFRFNTKSLSQAQDLFYTYDAVAHFANKDRSAIEFITLEALGKSIVNAYGVKEFKLLMEKTQNHQLDLLRKSADAENIVNRLLHGCEERPSVVLIDEIDKAPRDFPNDILNEIENYEFTIRELGLYISLSGSDKKKKAFVLITSNFDKNLPDAFLRRCLFHEIEFPDTARLKLIIETHIPGIRMEAVETRIQEFLTIRRNEGISKPPSTSELIDCLKWLNHQGELEQDIFTNPGALITLLKKKSDLILFKNN